MVVIDIGPLYPVLPPIPPAKKTVLQRLKEIYNRRKKKTLNGKHRWFEIFRRKKRNMLETHASLEEREIQNESLYPDIPSIIRSEEHAKDGPNQIEKPPLAQKKVIKTHVTTSGIGFKSGASKSVKSRWSTPGSEEVVRSSVSGGIMTKVVKPLPVTSKAQRFTGKTTVAPRKSSKFVHRSCVPETNMVARDEKNVSRAEEERKLNVEEAKQLSELEKQAMEVDALIKEVQNIDMTSVKPVKRFIGPQPHSSLSKDNVLEGLEELLDDVENFKECSAAIKPRPAKYEEFTDEVLDGLDDLMDDVYDNW